MSSPFCAGNVNKWCTFGASTFLQLVGGMCYTFPLYSAALKESLHLSQPALEAVGTAILSGGYFAPLAGLVYDKLQEHNKLGPMLTATVAIVGHTAGYLGIWLTAKHLIHVPFLVLILFALLASSAIVWLDAACIVTCMRNFPNERGNVSGILKSWLGLSASICATVQAGLFQGKQLSFLLFVALVPVGVGITCIPLLNHVPYLEASEVAAKGQWLTTKLRFQASYGLLLAFVLYQIASTSASEALAFSYGQMFWVMLGTVALIVPMGLVAVGSGGLASCRAALDRDYFSIRRRSFVRNPVGGGDRDAAGLKHAPGVMGLGDGANGIATQPGNPEDGQEGAPLLDKSRDLGSSEDRPGLAGAGGTQGTAEVADARLPSLTLGQCVRTLDYWLLWGAFLTGMGTGFAFINNLGQIVESLGGGTRGQGPYVLMFATMSTLGRMTCGYVPERLLHSRAMPRSVFLAGAGMLSAAAAVLSAVADLRWLYSACLLGGFAFGCHWSLMPAMTSELFGLRHFAANQSVIHAAPTLGGLLFGAQLVARLYAARGAAHGDPPGACLGPDCFRAGFLIIAGLAAAQACASVLLWRRTLRSGIYAALYQRVRRYEAAIHVLSQPRAEGEP